MTSWSCRRALPDSPYNTLKIHDTCTQHAKNIYIGCAQHTSDVPNTLGECTTHLGCAHHTWGVANLDDVLVVRAGVPELVAQHANKTCVRNMLNMNMVGVSNSLRVCPTHFVGCWVCPTHLHWIMLGVSNTLYLDDVLVVRAGVPELVHQAHHNLRT